MTYDPVATGKKIKKLREAAKMNQYDLAVALNVSHSHVSKIELGKRVGGVDIYVSIATIFGVSLDYLLSDEKEDEDTEIAKRRLRIAMALLKDVEKLLD